MLNKVYYVFTLLLIVFISFAMLASNPVSANGGGCAEGTHLVDGQCVVICTNPGPYGICFPDTNLGLINEDGSLDTTAVLSSTLLFGVGILLVLNGSKIKQVLERN